jgi:hypothetical protein
MEMFGEVGWLEIGRGEWALYIKQKISDFMIGYKEPLKDLFFF